MASDQEIKELICTLGSNSSQVKWTAVVALAKIGEDAVEPLINALTNKNQRIRAYAVETLVQIVQRRIDVDLKELQKVLTGFIGEQPEAERINLTKEYSQYFKQIHIEIMRKKQRMRGVLSIGRLNPPKNSKTRLFRARRVSNG